MRIFPSVLLTGAILAFTTSPLLADADANIKARFQKLLPEYQIASIRETPVGGLYEVVMQQREVIGNARVIYVSGDGRYMMQGQLIDLAKREDLTGPRLVEIREAAAPQLATARKAAVDKLGDDQMVVFSPDKYRHTVTVFTDIDCGYCQKLHREIGSYGEEGIRVRYVFYPRAGVGSDSYDKAVSVWCADDRKQALTDAKARKHIPTKSCDNPVKDHMALGEQIGVSGTPAILIENGELIPGYVPAKRLASILEGKEP